MQFHPPRHLLASRNVPIAVVETAFYSKSGIRQGRPAVRVASLIEMLMELYVADVVFARAAPLVERLRRRTLTRGQYAMLVSIFTENALLTGQVDETDVILATCERMWARCPARYLPDWRRLLCRLTARPSGTGQP